MKLEAKGKCSRCGRTTARLAVHHKVPVETGRTADDMERLCFDEDNLQVVCYDCHALIHQEQRTTKRDIHDERTKDRVKRFLDKFLKK